LYRISCATVAGGIANSAIAVLLARRDQLASRPPGAQADASRSTCHRRLRALAEDPLEFVRGRLIASHLYRVRHLNECVRAFHDVDEDFPSARASVTRPSERVTSQPRFALSAKHGENLLRFRAEYSATHRFVRTGIER
jgi:hypothetical protein